MQLIALLTATFNNTFLTERFYFEKQFAYINKTSLVCKPQLELKLYLSNELLTFINPLFLLKTIADKRFLFLFKRAKRDLSKIP